MSKTTKENSLFISIIEFFPLIIFFALNKKYGIVNATTALVILTIVCLGIVYTLTKRVSIQALLGGIVVTIFGSLTILLNNEIFIKLKPTIVNLIFGTILFVGILLNKNFIKTILQGAIKMNSKGWDITAKLWCGFFFFLAILNEVVWRNFTTDQWVNFKVFGVTVITLLFSIGSIAITFKYIEK